MEYDTGSIFTTNFRSSDAIPQPEQPEVFNPPNVNSNIPGGQYPLDRAALEDDSIDNVAPLFKLFIASFRIDNEYVYMTMLRKNLKAQLHFIEINVTHLQKFSESLVRAVMHSPLRTTHRLEQSAVELASELKLFTSFDHPEMQVQLFWPVEPSSVRQLAHEEVAKLVCINGIVIKASAVHARCTRAVIQCTSCRSKTIISMSRGSLNLPPQCIESMNNSARKKCRPYPYLLIPSECSFEDQQVLKLQEAPEDVPTGELPRQATVIVDRYLVDKVSPGTRIQVAGIISVQDKKASNSGKRQRKSQRNAAGLRAQYIKGVGLMVQIAHGGDGADVQSINYNFSSKVRSRGMSGWQTENEALFKRFARETPVYDIISESIDPAVLGLKDQKKAIACLLFGGTRKKIESNFLRGDMNVLLIGDPSTAKSQLLKFTEKIAPIGIYTSGKGSSAAGLTATVVGGGNGDFWLEAGSMVLADGGVVCIDEFDKMREQDQVAIHEAMEQQTISIAKANLTTMLNSRTSVLAAANPNMGSYDPLKSNEEQIDFAASILTRFDLIFKVLDPRDPVLDMRLAKHVVNLHKTSGPAYQQGSSTMALFRQLQTKSGNKNENNSFSLNFLTKYIAYAKATCTPQISEDAKATLLDFFVEVRRNSHAAALSAMSSGKNQTPLIQITARQLESLIRVTESLAKMRLVSLATSQDAEEAIRLFKTATVDAINSGVTDMQLTEQQSEIVQRIEDTVRKRVIMGATVLYTRLTAELLRLGFEGKMIDKALYVMMRRDEIEWRKQRTMIHRMR